jgi:hypothetical protein
VNFAEFLFFLRASVNKVKCPKLSLDGQLETVAIEMLLFQYLH